MFGLLRLFLAAVVVTFHAGVQPWGLYTGVSAVVVFYILSGYVITALLTTRFPTVRAVLPFLVERTIRLAPQYYLWLAVSFLFVFGLHWTPIDVGKPSQWTLFSYVTLIPLGLQRYLSDVDFPFIPQATSLAIEAIMYLIAPFVIRSRFLSACATLVFLTVFFASATGVLPPSIYTYYTAPAPMVFFMLGSFVYRREWALLGTGTAAILLILLMGWHNLLYPEMIIGVIFGLPVIYLLRSHKGGAIDAALGNASYGCFLCQVMIFDALIHFGFARGSVAYILVAVILSCAGGYASFWLAERPTIGYRRRFRAPNPSSSSGTLPAAIPAGLA